MNTRQQLGLFLGLAAVAAGGYVWYRNQKPKFQILEFNHQDRNVTWQYGSIVQISQAGQNQTYSSSPNADYYVNVSSLEEKGEIIGLRFNFLGKDDREPKFVYFN